MRKKHRVLSVWATLALVFAAITLIAGATVLALYLMGTFNKDGVAPGDDLTFVMMDGLGHMEGSEENPTFYLSEENCVLQVETGVENVTQKELTLYFDSSKQTDVDDRPGYITDGVIIVKERAQLGEKIVIEFAKDRNNESWINGGVSTLWVRSLTNSDSVTDKSCKIVVDVPVEKEGFSVGIDQQTGDEQTVVVSVPSFHLNPMFTPAKSGYYFADSQQQKLVFYSILTHGITQEDDFDYNEFKPVAVTTGNPERIRYYTFKNSEYQRQFLTERQLSITSDPRTLDTQFQDYRLEHKDQVVENDVNITVEGVSVTDVSIGLDKALDLRIDKNFHLTAKRALVGEKDFGTLDVSIGQDSQVSSEFVTSLYANIGIRIPTEVVEGVTQIQRGFAISGGRVIEIDKQTFAISEPAELTAEEINAKLRENADKLFYVLPYTKNIVSPDDYYWNISSEKPLSNLKFAVNFFQEKTEWEAFFKFDGEEAEKPEENLFFYANSSLPDQAEPAWRVPDTLSLTITSSAGDDVGNSARVSLPALLQDVPQSNIYRTVRYFLVKPFGNESYNEFLNGFRVTDYFDQISAQAKTYQTYYDYDDVADNNVAISISGISGSETGYELYEFTGNYIIAKKELPSYIDFYIVAMLVRTNADGKVMTDNDGKYQIIKNSAAKLLTVESTLSIENMEGTFSIDHDDYSTPVGAEGSGNYYIPSRVKDEEGNDKNVIKFNLKLNNVTEVAANEDKIMTAYRNGTMDEKGTPWLTVVALGSDGRELDFVKLMEFRPDPSNGQGETSTLSYNGEIYIDPQAFQAKEGELDSGMRISLELRYFDGREVLSKSIDDGKGTNFFYVYYQQPKTIEFDASEGYVSDNPYISISIDADNVDIKWGSSFDDVNAQTINSIAELRELLKYTIKDRFGRVLEPSTDYRIRLEEDPDEEEGETSGLLSFNESRTQIGDTFKATSISGGKTTLVAKVVNSNGQYQTTNGSSTGDQIVCETRIKFFVKSVGISSIKKDVSRTYSRFDGDISVGTKDMQEIGDDEWQTNLIEVSKYVTTGSKLNFDDMVEFYSSSSPDTPTQIKVGVSASFYNDLDTTQREDLIKMLTFNQTIPFGLTEDIKSIEFKYPFGEDTYLDFTVTDTNGGSLFKVTLRLRILSNIRMATTFDNYASNNNFPTESLVRSTTYLNASPVFAGAVLPFATYMPLTVNSEGITKVADNNITYAWTDYFKDGAGLQDYFAENPNGIEISYEGLEPAIKVKDRYTFGRASFEIYYGVVSQYALHQAISLYVNPDVVIVLKSEAEGVNPYVDLGDDITNADPSNNFELHSFTKYLNKGAFSSEPDGTLLDGVTYTLQYNGEGEQFISIGSATSGMQYSFVMDGEASKLINLYYGQKFEQSYTFSVGAGDSAETLECAVARQYADTQNMSLGKEGEAVQLSIDFGIAQKDNQSFVFSGRIDDSTQDVEKIGDYAPVVKVKKDDAVQTYVVIEPLSAVETKMPDGYYTDSDYVLSSATGFLELAGQDESLHLRLLSGAPFLSTEGNSFTATKTLRDGSDKTLRISLLVNVIVTGMGKDNVYYYNPKAEESKYLTYNEMKFNNFGDVTYDVLIGDYTGLESNNVYQVLDAGKTYNLVHDISEIDTTGQLLDPYGFYYNSYNSENITTTLSIIKASANGSGQDVSSDGKQTNLAKINGNNIEINHLESAVDDAYLVLKLEIKETSVTGRAFEWYYRIKINPSFTKGAVLYPYVINGNADGEYLNSNSSYYKRGHYEIPLEEEYNFENSSHASGHRFGDLTSNLEETKGEKLKTERHYEISRVYLSRETSLPLSTEGYSTYFDHSFGSDAVLSITVKTTLALTIFVRQYHVYEGMRLIGSEQEYILRFNQMAGFEHQLEYSKSTEPLKADNDVYSAELKQGETGEFTPDIKKKVAADRVSNYLDYQTYLTGNDGATELHREMFVKSGAVVTLPDEKEAEKQTKTLDADLAFDEWMTEAQAEALLSTAHAASSEDQTQVVDVTIGKVNYTVKLEDIDFRYHLGSKSIVEALQVCITYNDETFWTKSIETTDDKKLKITKEDDSVVEANVEDITWSYIQKSSADNNRNKLTIKAKDKITQYHYFTIGVYSEEGVIFKIDLTVASIYTFTKKEAFEGNKTYAFEGGVFSEIKENNSALTKDIELQLLNGDEKAGFGAEITLADLVNIDNQNDKISFAALLQNVEFKFNVNIKNGDVVEFTFPISMLVGKSFNIPAANQYFTDDRAEFAGYAFQFGIDTALNNSAKKTIKETYELNDLPGIGTYSLIEKDEKANTVSITPAAASSDELRRTQTLRVGYYFNSSQTAKEKLIFDFEFTFVYYVNRSVQVDVNYPDPDGKTENGDIGVEYIATSKAAGSTNGAYTSETFNAFFVTEAMFAKEKRIETGYTQKFAKRYKDDHSQQELDESAINKEYTVSITTIESGLTVYVSSAAYSAQYKDVGTILPVGDLKENGSLNNLNIGFALDQSVASANVVFNVNLNGVSKEYNVRVVQGDVLSLVQSPTNYEVYDDTNKQAETIYVEDLNEYYNASGEQEHDKLFAQSRLTTYRLNKNQVGKTLYARFTDNNKPGQAVVIQIDTSTSDRIYYDMGRSLKDYTYDAIYGINQNGNVSDIKENAEVFDLTNDGLIRVTSRLTAYYYNIEILTDITIERRLKTTSGSAASYGPWSAGESNSEQISITKADNYDMSNEICIEDNGYDKANHVVTYSFAIKYKDSEYFSNVDYSIRLATELLVQGNANDIGPTKSLNGLKVQTIEAGSNIQLMSASSFGFKNARTKTDLTEINSSATIGLGIYGFTETPIEQSDDKLTNSAYNLHQYLLKAYQNGDEKIDYYTGLTPRYGMTLNNNPTTGAAADNYLMYYGQSGKDYRIDGQHCSNDGNYVMIRMSYRVTWGTTTVEQYNNLLFKVVPGNGIRVEYKKGPSGTTYSTDGLTNEVRDGRTYVSNAGNVYTFSVTNSNQHFYFTNNNSAEGQPANMPVLKLITKDPEHNESAFTFTYQHQDGGEYNSFNKFIDSVSTWTNTENKYTISGEKPVRVTIPQTTLGTKKLYITYEDVYGFRGYFYFDIQTTDVEPAFAENSVLQLQEGQKMVFSIAYQNVSIEGDSGNNWISYKQFTYAERENELEVASGNKTFIITGLRVTATLASGATYIKEATTEKNEDAFGDNKLSGDQTTYTMKIWERTGSDKTLAGDSRGEGIALDNLWLSGSSKGLTQAQLNNAIIVFEFQYKKVEPEKDQDIEVGEDALYTTTYNGQALVQTHAVGSTYIPSDADLGISDSDNVKNIAITGIGAYAYDASLGAVDKSSVKDTLSRFVTFDGKTNDIRVTSVRFRLKSDHTTYASAGTRQDAVSTGTEEDTPLLTGSNKFFVVKNSAENSEEYKTIQGKKYVSGKTKAFTVPAIQGKLYGLSDVATGIEMAVTLASGQETQVIVREVEITKEKPKGENGPFAAIEVLDGNSVGVNDEGNVVANDTLEVELEGDEYGFLEISLDGGAVHREYVSNDTGYKKTVYVRISGNDYNMKSSNIAKSFKVVAKGWTRIGWSHPSIYPKVKYNGQELNWVWYDETGQYHQAPNATGWQEIDGKYYREIKDMNEADVNDCNIFAARQMDGKNIGREYTLEEYNQKSTETNITLRINDPSELSGNIKDGAGKTEKLYFLYGNSLGSTNVARPQASGCGEMYRFEKDFKVYPKYSTAKIPNTITVSDYGKVEKEGSQYYVIPFASWASGVTLRPKTDNAGTTLSEAVNLKNGNQTPYQFYYSIDAYALQGSGSPGGAAYIDEFGTITTTENFNPTSDGLAVDIYMNVSGFDGLYQNDISTMENKAKMHLGTAYISLEYKDSWGNALNDGTSGIYYTNDNNKTTVDYFVADVDEKGGLFGFGSVARFDDNKVAEKNITATTTVGSKVDLRKLFEQTDTNSGSDKSEEANAGPNKINKHYHLVKIGDQDNKNQHYVPYNNLDYYTFATAGTYTLTLLETCREKGESAYQYAERLVTAKIIVYSNTASPLHYTKVVSQSENEGVVELTTAIDGDKFGNKSVWYELDKEKNTIKKVDEGKFNIKEKGLGLNSYSFLVQKENETTLVDVDFWIYNNGGTAGSKGLQSDEKNEEFRIKRVSTTRADYNLSTLFAPQSTTEGSSVTNYSYTLYTYENTKGVEVVGGSTGEKIEKQTFGSASFGTPFTVRYLVVEYKRTGNSESISNCFLYQVTFYLNQNSQTSVQMVERSNSTVEDSTIEEKVAAVFGQVADGNAEIYERDETSGELKTINDVSDLNGNSFTKEFVRVVTKGTSETFSSIKIMFYVYDGAAESNKTPTIDIYTSEHTRFSTSELDTYVKAEAANVLNEVDNLTIEYFEFEDGVPNTNSTLFFPLIQDTTKHFYVVATGTQGEETKHFYLDFTFNMHVGVPEEAFAVVEKTNGTHVSVDAVLAQLKTTLQKLPEGATIKDDAQLYTVTGRALQSLTSENIDLSENNLQNGYLSGTFGIKYSYTIQEQSGTKTVECYAYSNVRIYFFDKVGDAEFKTLNLAVGMQSGARAFSASELDSFVMEALGLQPTREPNEDPNPKTYPYEVKETSYEILGYREYLNKTGGQGKLEDVYDIQLNYGQSNRYLLALVKKSITTTQQESAEDEEQSSTEYEYLCYKLNLDFAIPSYSNNVISVNVTYKDGDINTPASDLIEKLKVEGVLSSEAEASVEFKQFDATVDSLQLLQNAEQMDNYTAMLGQEKMVEKTYLAVVKSEENTFVCIVYYAVERGITDA